jgi:hypothetical protein
MIFLDIQIMYSDQIHPLYCSFLSPPFKRKFNRFHYSISILEYEMLDYIHHSSPSPIISSQPKIIPLLYTHTILFRSRFRLQERTYKIVFLGMTYCI